MRPRPSGRGEPILGLTGRSGTATSELQCGHGLRAVERTIIAVFVAAPANTDGDEPWELQCGHGLRGPWKTGLAPTRQAFRGVRRRRAASMRPRLARRGEHLALETQRLTQSASFNAATAFGPWRTRGARGRSSAPPGFNAATAFGPWRTASSVDGGGWAVSFNAATAFGPWRTNARLAGSDLVPRFNAATAFGPWRTWLPLPCERSDYGKFCFNAATAFGPWRTERGLLQLGHGGLQCGHGSLAVENDLHGRGPRRAIGASMRPRLARRGEPYSVVHKTCSLLGFNAATARSPWRTTSAAAAPTAIHSLQCGHGSLAVENMRPAVRDRGTRLGVTSMRPRPSGRGERRRRTRF